MPSLEKIPALPYLSGRCQRFSNIGQHSMLARVGGRLRFGLGLRAGLERLLRRGPSGPATLATLGAPSRLVEGEWVRVLDEPRLRATLDARSKLRGLEFCTQQWFSCGRSYRVTKVVRRIIDDGGVFRAVNGTVLLDGVDCGGEHGTDGCGRFCPMMYRDEWLEAVDAPHAQPEAPLAPSTMVRVRSAEEIRRTLDPLGRRDGLMFMPEMALLAGQNHRVARRITRVQELDVWVDLLHPVYVLEAIRCSGAILGNDGPCHRQCLTLWHKDWLDFA